MIKIQTIWRFFRHNYVYIDVWMHKMWWDIVFYTHQTMLLHSCFIYSYESQSYKINRNWRFNFGQEQQRKPLTLVRLNKAPLSLLTDSDASLFSWFVFSQQISSTLRNPHWIKSRMEITCMKFNNKIYDTCFQKPFICLQD